MNSTIQMNCRPVMSQRARFAAAAVLLALGCHAPLFADSGCATGAAALADAFVLSNPLYAHFLGGFEAHVSNNADQYRAGSDAVRCAAALSSAFAAGAGNLYDPADLQRRDELNTTLGTLGIAAGPQQATASMQLSLLSDQLGRLARILPPAAEGDFGPSYSAATDTEQMQIVAGQLMIGLLRDPSMAAVMTEIEPVIREAIAVERRIILEAAAHVANQP